MGRRRERGTGSVFQRADGRWCGVVDCGYSSGSRRRRYVYGKSAEEVEAKIVAGVPEPKKIRSQGIACTRCRRRFPPEDIHLEWCGGCTPWGQVRGPFQWPQRPAHWRLFSCERCNLQTWTSGDRVHCLRCEPADPKWHVRAGRERVARMDGRHTAAEWRELCHAWGDVCAYCGAAGPLTKDHVVAIARGGSDLIENITPACRRCNAAKQTASAVPFAQRRRA